MHSDLIRQAVLLLHFRVVSLDSGCEEESPSHGTGKGWGAEGGKVRCPMSLSCGVCKCLCEPSPPLLHLLCFLQTCSTDKGPCITCKLLCYFCSLMLYTELPSRACFCFFLQHSESWHNLCWHLVLLTDWSAVLSSYPERWCHISPTWCTRILILAGPTHDLSLFQAGTWLWRSQYLELDGPFWKTRLIEMPSFTLQLYLLERQSWVLANDWLDGFLLAVYCFRLMLNLDINQK